MARSNLCLVYTGVAYLID